MKIKDILKKLREETARFIKENGDNEHDPIEYEDRGNFYIMTCEDGNYWKVNMENSHWIEEDDGTIVFRINDW